MNVANFVVFVIVINFITACTNYSEVNDQRIVAMNLINLGDKLIANTSGSTSEIEFKAINIESDGGDKYRVDDIHYSNNTLVLVNFKYDVILILENIDEKEKRKCTLLPKTKKLVASCI